MDGNSLAAWRVPERLEILRRVLTNRFGPLPPEVLAAIDRVSGDRVNALVLAALDVPALADLRLPGPRLPGP